MRHNLDLGTILVFGSALALVIGAMVLGLVRKRKRGELWPWSLANLAAAGFFASSLALGFTPGASSLALMGGLALLALASFVSAAMVLLGRNPPYAAHGSLVLATAGFLLLSTLLGVPARASLAILALAVALVLGHGAWTLRRLAIAARMRNGPGTLAGIFAIIAVLQLAGAAYLTLFAGRGSFPPAGGGATAISALVFGLFIAATNVSLLVVFMARLEREIASKVFELDENRDELKLLLDVFEETSGSMSLEEVLPRVVDLVMRKLSADAITLYLKEANSDDLMLAAQRGLDQAAIGILSRPVRGSSVVWKAYASRSPHVWKITDYPESELRKALGDLGIKVVGGFPIATRGVILGAMAVCFRDPTRFDERKVALLGTMALQLGAILRTASLHEELDRANARLDNLASTDALTGLANRRAAIRALDREIARAARSSSHYAVIMCDMDHFKSFNDTHGHDCGDYVLANLAEILARTLRVTDLAARWGGEEFLVILGEAEPAGAVALAERIRSRVEAARWEYGGKRLSVTITLGVAVCSPETAGDEAISLADAALYEGKRAGRNRVSVRGGGRGESALLGPSLLEAVPPEPAAKEKRADEGDVADLIPVDE